MKIISLTAENVKRLRAVTITPEGNLVQITGKNGAGKTSVLDAIWWALAGASHVQPVPIRTGAEEARIRLDLGELKITRTFRRNAEGETTTTIHVESADGARYPSPQKMLDALLGSLTFDPLAFARMSPKEQFDTLRRFVPGVDFEGFERRRQAAYDTRKALNAEAKNYRGAAAKLPAHEDLPDAIPEEEPLIDELGEVGEHNASVEAAKQDRERTRQQIDSYRQKAAQIRADIEQMTIRAAELDENVAAMMKGLDDAPEIPAAKDAAEVRARLNEVRAIRAKAKERDARRKALAEAAKLEQEASDLTTHMEALDAEKQGLIATASMPVPGLAFGSGCVLLNGVPFEQGSDAEQLRASVAIAMAMNPKLRVVRVRDGSLLDQDGLKLLAAMAEDQDCQVWIEQVDSSGQIGFVIEDGQLKDVASTAAA